MHTTTGSSQNVGADAGQRGRDTFAAHDTVLNPSPFLSASVDTADSTAPPPLPPRHPHPPLPPRHPHNTVTAGPRSTSSYNPSSSAGASVGTRVRGVFEAIHGAGEAIRGNVNSALDGLGDGIANRPQGTVESRQSAASEESVAQKGVRELNEGINAVKGGSAAAPSTTTGTGAFDSRV
ncbi:hypothetical protein JCM3770_003091 [Rhodotorula araucariae]